MKRTGANCVIFSSQTGVNVNGALRKLSAYSRARHRRVVVRKIEPVMMKEFLKQFPGDSSSQMIRGVSGMQSLVFKPKCLLLRLWKDAIDNSLRALPIRRTLFLSLHPILYSSDSREYFSPVDLDYLKRKLNERGRKVGAVISLIDDIYDIYRRLRAPNELLSDVEYTGEDSAILQSIVEIMMLLDWRAQEIMRAEQIAQSLGVRHYVLATKHPLSVAYDLIFTAKTPVYISHPISAVRALERRGKKAEAKRIKSEINSLIRRLVKSSKLTPIFPTTIDEFRISQDGDRYIPALTERWPFDSPRRLLYCNPPKEPRNPLDPDRWFKAAKKNKPEKLPMLHELLKTLRDRIGMQVGARDKKLVEQSDGLVVFRPYFGGTLSEGVQKEIAHRNTLNEYCPKPRNKRPSAAAVPDDDLMAVRIKLIVDELAQTGRMKGQKLSQSELMTVSTRIHANSKVTEMIKEGKLVGTQLQRAVETKSKRIGFEGVPKSLGPLSGELKPVQRRWLVLQWQQLAERVNQEDPLKKDLISGLDSVLSSKSIKELVRRAESTLGRK